MIPKMNGSRVNESTCMMPLSSLLNCLMKNMMGFPSQESVATGLGPIGKATSSIIQIITNKIALPNLYILKEVKNSVSNC